MSTRVVIRTKCIHCGGLLTVETSVSEPRLGPPKPTTQKKLELIQDDISDICGREVETGSSVGEYGKSRRIRQTDISEYDD